MIKLSDILHARILIVDDRAANVRLLEQMLAGAGYTGVASTLNPHEVCELHRRNRYDLILLDLLMPGMDGFAVLEGLKDIETDSYVPVLVLTAEPGHKLRALQAGAKDFISKPFDMPEVLMRVRNMLEVRLMHEMALNHAQAMASLALRDPLTGLANRRLLDDRLGIAMAHARRSRSAVAVVYLDLDGFKQINDTLGHSTGDTLLKIVAERLLATVREGDTVARQGGDEFMIVLFDASAGVAGAVVAKMIEAVAQPYVIDGHTAGITASAGISIYSDHSENMDTLMKSADAALYGAKLAGKNTYRIAQRANPSGLTRNHGRSAFGARLPPASEKMQRHAT